MNKLLICLTLALLSNCSMAMSEVSCMDYYEDQDYKTRGFTGDIKASRCNYSTEVEILDVDSFIFPSFVESSQLGKVAEEVYALKVKRKTYEETNYIIGNRYGFYLSGVTGLDLLLSVIYDYVKPNTPSNFEHQEINQCSLLKQESDSNGFRYIIIKKVGIAEKNDVLVEQALEVNVNKKYYRVTYFSSSKPIYLDGIESVCKRKEPFWEAHRTWLAE
ncbi:hypothetical protein HG263_22120 [Pseudoalteromonas sp. JBTF-M23]|uniref:Lipoprotein n=1 Tax=Pseudoalteromonas caenipelagi TaxID=2726988 RepID=A0A849VHF2_9GAMM|nr:hypothetical protein [Pseudoalteromonas caenipelagi]NOU53199.1 hypothetical protein [Pseudoalteromonas caenipelagi]